MAFVQNLPFIGILLTLIVAVITSVIGRRKAIWVTTALITAVTAMTVCVLAYVKGRSMLDTLQDGEVDKEREKIASGVVKALGVRI